MARTGKFLGIPYDFRRPTRDRVRKRHWNPEEERRIVPKVWGWGWDVNLRRRRRKDSR